MKQIKIIMDYISIGYYYYSFLFILNIIIRYKKKYLLHKEFLDLQLYLLRIYLYVSSFYLTYDYGVYIDFIDKSRPNTEIIRVINYNIFDYITNTIFCIYDKEYLYIFHHLITSLFFHIIKSNEFHHITLLTLLLFQLSSPMISVAKLFRQYKYKKLSEITYCIFGFTFFICRIVYFSFMLYKALFNHYYGTYRYFYINFILIVIYKLQWYWMNKIIKTFIINTKKIIKND